MTGLRKGLIIGLILMVVISSGCVGEGITLSEEDGGSLADADVKEQGVDDGETREGGDPGDSGDVRQRQPEGEQGDGGHKLPGNRSIDILPIGDSLTSGKPSNKSTMSPEPLDDLGTR